MHTRVVKQCSHRPSPSRCRGFTLVEMIVVMGIVGVLLALVLPALGTVRSHSQEAVCQSNLRQIGAAIESYRQNHDGALPNALPLPSNDPYRDPDGLPGALRHIIPPDSEVCRCPSDHIEGVCASYFYVAGAFMMIYPPEPYPAAREVTRFFETEGSNIPILWDSEDRHFIGTALPRNGLYLDGHVARVGEPFTIPTMNYFPTEQTLVQASADWSGDQTVQFDWHAFAAWLEQIADGP